MQPRPRIKIGLVSGTLRIVLGLYFLFGGIAYLGQLQQNIGFAEHLTSGIGSINALFATVLFQFDAFGVAEFGLVVACLNIALGLFLTLGLWTRLMCTLGIIATILQLVALPVITLPGVDIQMAAFQVPAVFALSFQMGLIGLLFAQRGMGASFSLDHRLRHQPANLRWNACIGLKVRLGAAYPLLVAGMFGFYPTVPNFEAWPIIALAAGLLLLTQWNIACRVGGVILAILSIWYVTGVIDPSQTFFANLNFIRPILVYFFVGMILTHTAVGRENIN